MVEDAFGSTESSQNFIIRATEIKKGMQALLLREPCMCFIDSPVDVPDRLELSLDVMDWEIKAAQSKLDEYIANGRLPVEANIWVRTEAEMISILNILHANYPNIKLTTEYVGKELDREIGLCRYYIVHFEIIASEGN